MAKKVTEETRIKHEVKDYLTFMGWFVFPVLQGLGAYRGISDFIACKNGKTVFIEIKTDKGKLSDYQIKFKADIEAAGCNYITARGWSDVRDI